MKIEIKRNSKYSLYVNICIFTVLLLLIGSSQKKNKTKKSVTQKSPEELYKYYENFNLTEEIEKKYDDEYENDKDKEYYENIENVDDYSTKKKSKKKEKKKEEELFEQEQQEWEKKINSFAPNNLLTVVLKRGEFELFYEEIIMIPSLITVAFYVNDEDTKIDFEIKGPKNKLIHKIKGKNRAFYEFNATVLGIYEFTLDNQRFKSNKKVTFATHTGANIESRLSVDHLQPLVDKISIVESKMKDIHFSQKMLNRKFEGHYTSTKDHNKNIVSYSVIETIIMLMIFLFQFFYIRSLIKSQTSYSG